jgi:hypothetical protein
MGIKAGAKNRLRIAGLFTYLTVKYGLSVFLIVGVIIESHDKHEAWGAYSHTNSTSFRMGHTGYN